MKRTLEIEMEKKTKNPAKAIAKFFEKHPELRYWEGEFEYMLENDIDFECDNMFGDGTKNNDWTYALHLDINEDWIYMCIIERA